MKKSMSAKIQAALVACLLLSAVMSFPSAYGANESGSKASQLEDGQFVLIDGGTFTIGDEASDAYDEEKPVRQVEVKSFYMGKYEVTFDEYDAFCHATGKPQPSDQGWGRGNRPVINVSWYDAVEYCNWRSKEEGLTPAYQGQEKNITCDFTANGYRLPTEAEWEYTAKGGNKSSTYQYSGSDNVDDVAWYKRNADGMTHPVGQKQANALGIYDMSGNAGEWCWDWYSRDKTAAVANPTGIPERAFRVTRGGSWYSDARFVRPAFHRGGTPGLRISYYGFRLVKNAM